LSRYTVGCRGVQLPSDHARGFAGICADSRWDLARVVRGFEFAKVSQWWGKSLIFANLTNNTSKMIFFFF